MSQCKKNTNLLGPLLPPNGGNYRQLETKSANLVFRFWLFHDYVLFFSFLLLDSILGSSYLRFYTFVLFGSLWTFFFNSSLISCHILVPLWLKSSLSKLDFSNFYNCVFIILWSLFLGFNLLILLISKFA